MNITLPFNIGIWSQLFTRALRWEAIRHVVDIIVWFRSSKKNLKELEAISQKRLTEWFFKAAFHVPHYFNLPKSATRHTDLFNTIRRISGLPWYNTYYIEYNIRSSNSLCQPLIEDASLILSALIEQTFSI